MAVLTLRGTPLPRPVGVPQVRQAVRPAPRQLHRRQWQRHELAEEAARHSCCRRSGGAAPRARAAAGRRSCERPAR
eukprot:6508344-Lingulodinium_polyedra.AAC.1